METRSVDLSQHRCPMSLLLAKRESHSLGGDEQLHLKVVDKTSLADIMKYFEQHSFDIHLEKTDSCSFLTVTRK
ncbi:sulfurtransferase TusA family protein [Aliivibrio sp. S3MY1]|uniref:sulfurtransferase TusA family protein n=1 Tax=unclassified Aliivibrio TaxID=2645654 RepID=UPI002379B71F|nr:MULTISPECIES: sulfurtransferase TusA family protein [unclassified Aliivibrio]MDD9196249.1 sulfurtransferase TusA family protein [Aliivibrio sp. S3MY1]MDD9199622.1 sulfurtransferase TusA family protein [Aliivibrio sp. S2MY1]